MIIRSILNPHYDRKATQGKPGKGKKVDKSNHTFDELLEKAMEEIDQEKKNG